MAYTPRAMREQMAANAAHQRELAAMNHSKEIEFVEAPFEWQTRQRQDAVFFPTHGWVPRGALRWRQPGGAVVPWNCGRTGDTFLMAAEYATGTQSATAVAPQSSAR